MAVIEKLLTKEQFLLYLDVKQDKTFEGSQWERIDKSTIFSIAMNEKIEEYDFIDQKNPVSEVEGNAPEMDQEIRLLEGNPMYDFMFEHFYDMPVGEACKIPVLMCFGGTGKKAWRGIGTITDKNFAIVDKKIEFKINLGGNIEKGTYTLSMGKPEFAPAEVAMV